MTTRTIRFTAAALGATALLAGCGSIKAPNLWPFGGGTTTTERSRVPTNAVEYRCAAGKHFYLRTLDGGEAIWLILDERQVRLERLGSSQRYSKGKTMLEVNGDEATLTDGAGSSFSGCKIPAPAAAG